MAWKNARGHVARGGLRYIHALLSWVDGEEKKGKMKKECIGSTGYFFSFFMQFRLESLGSLIGPYVNNVRPDDGYTNVAVIASAVRSLRYSGGFSAVEGDRRWSMRGFCGFVSYEKSFVWAGRVRKGFDVFDVKYIWDWVSLS